MVGMVIDICPKCYTVPSLPTPMTLKSDFIPNHFYMTKNCFFRFKE